MKCLSLIIHRAAKQKLVDLLLDMREVESFTVVDGEGHSPNAQSNPFETKHDLVVGFVPRIRVDIILPKMAIERVLTSLSHCESCVEGTGHYWITEVEESGSL